MSEYAGNIMPDDFYIIEGGAVVERRFVTDRWAEHTSFFPDGSQHSVLIPRVNLFSREDITELDARFAAAEGDETP